MFLKIARESHFNLIKSTLTPFNYLSREFHDPTLDFKTRLHRFVTENDKPLGLSNIPWIGILWKRDNIVIPQDLSEARRFRLMKTDFTTDPDKPTAEIFKTRYGSCPMSLAIYSNDPDYLETFEEYMFLLIEPIHPIDVNYPMLNSTEPFKALATDFKRTSFTKEERENFGTLAKLSISYNLIYPITKNEGITKLIKNILIDVKPVKHFD